jgi:hypothetical protein
VAIGKESKKHILTLKKHQEKSALNFKIYKIESIRRIQIYQNINYFITFYWVRVKLYIIIIII